MLAHYLVFKQGTLLSTLASLEDAGYVQKLPHPDDARALLVSLSNKGFEMAGQLADEVYEIMTKTFWQSLPSGEYFSPLKELENQLSKLRGYAIEGCALNIDTHGLTHALLFRTIELIIYAWAKAVKDHAGLSFNEGRILLLLELSGKLAPSEIAQRLHLDRSLISLSLKHLYAQEWVFSVENTQDKRRKSYLCTAGGLTLARELLSLLRKTTCTAYETYSDDAVITLNAQHMRMYSDLHHARSTLKIILSD